jgi:hypothetical protein
VSPQTWTSCQCGRSTWAHTHREGAGAVLGKIAFGSSVHVQLGWRFRFTRSFGYPGEFWQCWFNGNANATRVMWVLLCRSSLFERCWPSVSKARAVVLRRRRSGRARSAAHREHLGPGLEATRARCP